MKSVEERNETRKNSNNIKLIKVLSRTQETTSFLLNAQTFILLQCLRELLLGHLRCTLGSEQLLIGKRERRMELNHCTTDFAES